MDRVRLLLSLVTIAIIVGPIAGILLTYQNNLLSLFIPAEVYKIVSGDVTEIPLEQPSFVGSQYNATSQTVALTFNFTNPFKFNLTITSISANIVCDADNFPLGNATLRNPVSIRAGETATITIFGAWTQAAINHFQTAHAGAETIDIDLVDFTISLKGISAQTNQRIKISDVPIQ